jgi:hypothetical protein
MFSMTIMDSDAFLDMPLTSQLLYVHLGMRADDEGFIGNPKRIIKMMGANEDDIKILLAKEFLLEFGSGIVVVKHWRVHNTIRMDRFAPTTYRKEKNQLYLEENRAYTLSKEGVTLATKRQPRGDQLAPQVKLSKDNIDIAARNPINAMKVEKIKAEIRKMVHSKRANI